jgi:hypothetical protein
MAWLTIVLALMALTVTSVRVVVCEKRDRKRAAAAVPVPGRRPRDLTRPVLRAAADLDDPADPRLSVCPVCGMDGDEVTLDGQFAGAWPAHQTCMWWLGDWKPPAGTPRVPVKVPHEVLQHLAGLWGTAVSGQSFKDAEAQEAAKLGITSRELDDLYQEAVRTGKVELTPVAILTQARQIGEEVRAAYAAAPAQVVPVRQYTRFCVRCGDRFTGTRSEIRKMQIQHQCR